MQLRLVTFVSSIRLVVANVSLALVMTLPISGQRSATCDSSGLRAVRSEATDTLRVTLRRLNGAMRLDPRFAMDALDALRRHFVLPPKLSLPFRVPLSDSLSTFGLVASVDFVARRDGSVQEMHLSRTSYVSALDSALLRALRGASSEAAFAPFDRGNTADELALVLDVAFGLEDSIRTGIDAALMQLPRHARMQMPRVLEPQRMPHFANARAAGSQLGAVDLSFAVSETGRVLPGTVEFTKVTTETLARAVLDVLPYWRFEPAQIAGCAVPALVSQSFRLTYPP
jgi:hypothetical protein